MLKKFSFLTQLRSRPRSRSQTQPNPNIIQTYVYNKSMNQSKLNTFKNTTNKITTNNLLFFILIHHLLAYLAILKLIDHFKVFFCTLTGHRLLIYLLSLFFSPFTSNFWRADRFVFGTYRSVFCYICVNLRTINLFSFDFRVRLFFVWVDFICQPDKKINKKNKN